MVQLQIINKILDSKNYSMLRLNEVDRSYFPEYQDEIAFIENHIQQFGNVPDKETFGAEFEDFEFISVEESDEYLISTLKEEYLYAKAVPVLQTMADKLQTDSNEAVAFLKEELPNLQVNSFVKGTDIISQAEDRYSEYQDIKNDREKFFMESGFKELDEITGGFHRGEELVVLFARTGIGKTWVAMKMAEHHWKLNKRVGLLEPEMSANKIGYRFDTLNKNISSRALMLGNDIAGYERYINNLKSNKTPFFVTHPRDFSNRVYVSKLKQWCETNKLDVLYVDGISYLQDERAEKGDSITNKLTDISEDLMQLSIDLKIPVIVVVQSNRVGSRDEDLDLENIRDSDGIAFNSSLVISIQQKQEGLQLKINKARNSRVGDKLVYLWEADKGTFQYIPQPDRGKQDEKKAENLRRKFENEDERY